MNCNAQSLFFDNLENTIWASDSKIDNSTLINSERIGLEKLNVDKDSLNNDVTIWEFKDRLVIKHINKTSKQEVLVGTYNYNIDGKFLIISFDANSPKKYNVGITSNGAFVILTEKKDKKKKNENHT